jgi:hypothetical protein
LGFKVENYSTFGYLCAPWRSGQEISPPRKKVGCVVQGMIYRDDMGTEVGIPGVTVVLKISFSAPAESILSTSVTENDGCFHVRDI